MQIVIVSFSSKFLNQNKTEENNTKFSILFNINKQIQTEQRNHEQRTNKENGKQSNTGNSKEKENYFCFS